MNLSYDVYWDDELIFLERAVDFLQEEFGKNGSPMWTVEYMQWKLSRKNPAGKGFLHVTVCNNKIIGTATLTKKRILVDGEEFIGGEVGDTYSSEKIRKLARPNTLSLLSANPSSYINKSIFGRCIAEITNRAKNAGIFYIYGTPNNNSYPGYTKRLNFIDIKGYKNWSMSKITINFAMRKLKIPKYLHSVLNSLGKIIACLYSSASKLYSEDVKFEILDKIPDEKAINELWNKVKPKTGFSLIRDGIYWNYRYLSHPLNEYKILAFWDQNSLQGLLALKLSKDKNDENTAIISEWLCTKNINFGLLLRMMMNYFRGIEIQKYNLWVRMFSKEFYYALLNGFIPSVRVPIIFFKSKEISKIKDSANDICFFIGNSDNV